MTAALTEMDYQALLDGIRRLHEEPDIDRLPYLMLEVVKGLVPCEHASFNELNPRLGRANSFFNEAELNGFLLSHLPAFQRHFDQHPILVHYVECERRGEAQQVLAISDFLSRRQYQQLALYCECLGRIDTEFQMVIPIDMNNGVAVGIAVNRKLIDFSPRDRQILGELLPHLSIAYQNGIRRLRLRRMFRPDCEQQAIEDLRKLGLTPREAQIAFWLLQGKTTPIIGQIIHCSPRTIEKHLQNLFLKLDVETRTAAISTMIERIETFRRPMTMAHAPAPGHLPEAS